MSYADGGVFGLSGPAERSRLDPRTGVVLLFAFMIAVVTTPRQDWQANLLYPVPVAWVLLLARLPVLKILKRSALILPFLVAVAIFVPFMPGKTVAVSLDLGLWQLTIWEEGLSVLADVMLKGWLSVVSATILFFVTPFPDLLSGLKRLGVPGILVMILSFLYRYAFVIAAETAAMARARDSRNYRGRHLMQARAIGNMTGALFLRTYERGERIYGAMVARGYRGELPEARKLALKADDAFLGIALLTALAGIKLAGILLTRG
ncbi:MAG: cobalt ECF transporter T component CbiQ [Chloroflexi bacterium]|nr:cobalt ECF transporter T component CbiQ [Chloroflexota bacterium]